MVLGVFFLNSEKAPFVRGAAPFHLNVVQYSPINRYSAFGSDIRIQLLHVLLPFGYSQVVRTHDVVV